MVKRYVIESFQILIGCVIMAFGISVFLLPNQLSSGGFSGISTITYYLFELPIGTTMFILNIPLMVIAYFRLGRAFLIKAIIRNNFIICFFRCI